MSEIKAVVLAAGKGTRMQSESCHLPKVLRQACGKPLLYHVLGQLSFPEKETIKQYKKVIRGLIHRFMGAPSREEAEYYGSLPFSDDVLDESRQETAVLMSEKELKALIAKVSKKMHSAAAVLNFERAAELRDQLIELKKQLADM